MRSKRRRIAWIMLVAVAVLATAGTLIARSLLHRNEKPKIETAEVDTGDVRRTISATGMLQPLTTVDIKSNVGGTVVELNVDEGARVKTGDVIARIDPSDALTVLDQQRANMQAAEAKVDQARDQSAMQALQSQASVESAQQAINSAQQSVQVANQNLETARRRLVQAEMTAASQPTITQAAIRQSQSALVSARASYQQLQAATIPQKISAAEAALDQAKANLDYAETDLSRQRALLDKGYVSQSTVDAAVQKHAVAKASYANALKAMSSVKAETVEELNAARAKVEQAEAALESANANAVQDTLKAQDVATARAAVKQSESGVKQAEASLRQAYATMKSVQAGLIQNRIRGKDIISAQANAETSKAQYKNAQTNLQYTTITSPCSGVVVKKFVDPGSIIAGARNSSLSTGSGVTIIQVADTTRMFALVNVDETDIAKISLGQKAEITIDAFPDSLPFDGVVTKIAPQAIVDQNVTTVPVTVEISHPDPRFKPTMNVNCQFILMEKKDVLRVPNEALSGSSDEEATVKVLSGRESWIERDVQLGFAGDDYTEITAGLEDGEKVVTQITQPEKKRNTSPAGNRPGSFGGGPMGGMRR